MSSSSAVAVAAVAPSVGSMDGNQAYEVLLDRTDALVDFFKHRQSVELGYATSLKKLHTKQTEIEKRWTDEGVRDETQLSWRKAMTDIIDVLSKECQAHQALAQRIGTIHKTLSDLRDNKDRTRRRIKEDFRNISNEHAEYKATVHRLRRQYEKRVEEVQQQEELSEDAHHPTQPSQLQAPSTSSLAKESFPPEHWTQASDSAAALAPTQTNTRERTDSNASRGAASDTLLSPQVSPPHNHVLVSGAAASHTTHRNDGAPSANAGKGNVFDAIAKRDWSGDKHRVNSIVRAVGNLAKGEPAAGGGLKPSNSKGRTRSQTTKLRRDAEQADRDYRDGIFRLETLRLQKERISRSAMISLREFAFDLSASAHDAFLKHVTDLVYLSKSRMAIAEKAAPTLTNIDAARDADVFAHQVKQPAAIEPQVYYVNAFVGECKNLLFGVSLADYHATRPQQLVPLIVTRCIADIDARGLQVEGIYRISGKLATVQQLVHEIEKDEENFHFTAKDDPALVAGVLKLYLRQLPVPLFPFPLVDRLALSHAIDADVSGHHVETNLQAIARRLRRLPRPHQATLKVLCEHLARVVQHVSVNKMTPTNLGLLFTPVVFGEDDGTTLEAALQHNQDVIMEMLITQHHYLFEGLPVDAPSQNRSRQGSFRATPQLHQQMHHDTFGHRVTPSQPTNVPSPMLHDHLAGLQLEQTDERRRSSSDVLRAPPERSSSFAGPPAPLAPAPQRPAGDESLAALVDHYSHQQQQQQQQHQQVVQSRSVSGGSYSSPSFGPTQAGPTTGSIPALSAHHDAPTGADIAASGGAGAAGSYEIPAPPPAIMRADERLSSTPPLSAAAGRREPNRPPPTGVDWGMDV